MWVIRSRRREANETGAAVKEEEEVEEESSSNATRLLINVHDADTCHRPALMETLERRLHHQRRRNSSRNSCRATAAGFLWDNKAIREELER